MGILHKSPKAMIRRIGPLIAVGLICGILSVPVSYYYILPWVKEKFYNSYDLRVSRRGYANGLLATESTCLLVKNRDKRPAKIHKIVLNGEYVVTRIDGDEGGKPVEFPLTIDPDREMEFLVYSHVAREDRRGAHEGPGWEQLMDRHLEAIIGHKQWAKLNVPDVEEKEEKPFGPVPFDKEHGGYEKDLVSVAIHTDQGVLTFNLDIPEKAGDHPKAKPRGESSPPAAEKDLVVHPDVEQEYPEVVKLIHGSQSMDDNERRYWLAFLPAMTAEQVRNLRDTLEGEVKQNERYRRLDKGLEASTLFLAGEYDELIAAMDKLIGLDSRDASAYLIRGLAHQEKGEQELAKADYDKAKALHLFSRDSIAVLLQRRGKARLNEGKFDEAISDYSRAIEMDPLSSMNYDNRGWAYRQKGNNEAAIGDCSVSIFLDPKNDWAYRLRAKVYWAEGRYDKALADFARAIELRPEDGSAYGERASLYVTMGKNDKALADYSKAVEVSPNDPRVFNSLAWLRATSLDKAFRNGKAAIENATKACELTNWKEAYYLDTLAAAYAEDGQFDEAVKWQTKALADPAFLKDVGTQEFAKARERLDLYKQKEAYRDR
ncbi:MAG TPA: tetratricopeptide repeat protein [Planctomycetota bacterium]|nr:tetratricopeptide repeat protein [Planctomycetota bacterium]